MKKTLLLPIALVAAMAISPVEAVASSFGKKESVTQDQSTRTFKIGDFRKMEISMCNVEYTIGTPGDAVLTAPANLIDKYEVVVKNGKLIVRFKDLSESHRINYTDAVKLRVSSKSLEEIEASTSSKVSVLSPIVVNGELEIEVSTTASVNFDTVVCGEISAEVSTASYLTINRLDSKKADLNSDTASNIKIQTAHISYTKLEADTSGSIDIAEGNVGKIDFASNTAGSIRCKAAVEGGKVEANTGGSIRCPIQNVNKDCDRGGSIKGI